MARFKPVSSRAQFAAGEGEVLDFWRRENVFQRGLEMRKEAPPFVFYEGPPTANGVPGIHHVLARSFKDLFPRYKQMAGFRVERKAGWDTHGLPVELEVEKQLKISGKRQIEDFGVAEFNKLCKASVSEYVDEWEQFTERMGFWLDMEHPYRTYDGSYIESVWWSLKQIWDRDLLYEGYKVTPYCPRCQTTLSSHELSLGYRDDTPDPSVFVKFRLQESDGSTYLMAWTTTPWTLPGNVALAVHPGETYVRVEQGEESLILAKARLHVLEGEYSILAEMPGSELVGRTYDPLFTDMLPDGKAFVVLGAPELVSMEDGTGIVHTAAAYGDADLKLCQREGVAIRHVVGLDGRFLEGQTKYRGQFVKDADPQIIKDLEEQGNLYKAATIKHTYPFCWRCDTPLIYYALTSWFIRTTAVKEALIDNNREVNWQPAHIRDGRMGNWLEGLVDWNLSRTRYWGTPLPIWKCEACENQVCVGSADELGLTTSDDLHKPFIDEVTIACEKCTGVMRRVPAVIDCWYDSGAMPFAQFHYPFENEDLFEQSHPADFICEAMDQTRGWFFSLLAISTLLFDKPAYKNVICLGLVLDKQGKKMSKRLGNIVVPQQVFDEYGADAARWYFYSAVSAGGEYRVGGDLVQDVVRRFFLTLWNTYAFFVTYANIDGYDPSAPAPPVERRNVLDRWILARLTETVESVQASLEAYDATNATRAIELLVEDLSKWYVKRSRRRFWKSATVDDEDKAGAYATLYEVLSTVALLIAPFTPFLAERMYRNLAGLEAEPQASEAVPISVHLCDFPQPREEWRDVAVISEMARIRRLVQEGLAAREEARIKVRQPLACATVAGAAMDSAFEDIFRDELNVKRVEYTDAPGQHEGVALDTTITEELRREGAVRELSRIVNDCRKKAGFQLSDRVLVRLDGGGLVRSAVDAHREQFMAEVLAHSIEWGRGEARAEWQGRIGEDSGWVGVAP